MFNTFLQQAKIISNQDKEFAQKRKISSMIAKRFTRGNVKAQNDAMYFRQDIINLAKMAQRVTLPKPTK